MKLYPSVLKIVTYSGNKLVHGFLNGVKIYALLSASYADQQLHKCDNRHHPKHHRYSSNIFCPHCQKDSFLCDYGYKKTYHNRNYPETYQSMPPPAPYGFKQSIDKYKE